MRKEAYSNPSGQLLEKDLHVGKEKNTYVGKAYPFIPNKLPPDILYDAELVSLLSEADLKFSRLNGAGLNLPNPYILMLPYIKKEAVVSSKIEGTQASLTDLFLYELTEKAPKDERLGLREVSNYVITMEQCLAKIKKRNWHKYPVNLELIKTAHKTLMQDVRGQEESPGIFRDSQNAIVPYKNCPPEEVLFFPPPPESIGELLNDLETFILNPPTTIPLLIQAALIHYQFESIHPFGDGNGRIGRLLLILYLSKKARIAHPLLYLSAYFESHKDEYGLRLRAVSEKSEWREWIMYFLKAVIKQSDEALNSVERLLKLRDTYSKLLRNRKATKNMIRLIDLLFMNPYIDAKTAIGYLKVSHQTAISCIRKLEELGIVREYGEKKRNIIYNAVGILHILGG